MIKCFFSYVFCIHKRFIHRWYDTLPFGNAYSYLLLFNGPMVKCFSAYLNCTHIHSIFGLVPFWKSLLAVCWPSRPLSSSLPPFFSSPPAGCCSSYKELWISHLLFSSYRRMTTNYYHHTTIIYTVSVLMCFNAEPGNTVYRQRHLAWPLSLSQIKSHSALDHWLETQYPLI